MRIGMLSRFPPEKDGIGIYTDHLVHAYPATAKIITIGSGDCDYHVDMKGFSLKEALRIIIEKEKLDLLHVQYIPPFYSPLVNLNLIQALQQAVPVVVTAHEVQYETKTMKRRIVALMEKAVFRRVRKVIVHTPGQAAYLKKKGFPAVHINMGLSPLKNQLPNKRNVLFFGMISRNKGLHVLLRAMESLSGYTLKVRGNPINKEVRSFIEPLLGKTDTKLGWISEAEKNKAFKDADLVVLPYLWAPYQSAVLADALSYGIPLVVTRTGAVWELVQKFDLGVVVKPNDRSALAKGIKTAYRKRKHLMKNILRFRKDNTWAAIAKRHVKLYNEIR